MQPKRPQVGSFLTASVFAFGAAASAMLAHTIAPAAGTSHIAAAALPLTGQQQLFAASAQSGALEGQQAFKRSCSRCHDAGKLPGHRVHDLQVAERREALDQFLSRHYARDARQRAAIIDYLAGLKR